ncbi:hypothetical protein DdX_18552 [Ditylenchus destructor]|uniref:Uncharacterized protein n=1 Tax=Ditylenchus destructor TaxID=166010 RepID=A0AAD4MPU8_9BILA|nr:hypothetical protein DdX_18552 [Ditylenchus destructor]
MTATIFKSVIIFTFCKISAFGEIQNPDFVDWSLREIVHFTGPLTLLEANDNLLEDWIEDAKDLHLEMYIDELASIVYDAIGVTESLIAYKPVLDTYIETAKLIGPPEVRSLRYVGEEKDFEANRRQFGKMFHAHIETLLLPKVKTGSHDGVMESHVPDVVKIRHFVDKHWTRHGRKNTTVETPDAEKKKWIIEPIEEL